MNLSYEDIEHLFHEHRYEVTRSLYRMVRCEQTAADLTQETFMRLVNLAQTSSVMYPRALLFKTATNLAIDYLRKGKSEQHSGEALELALEVPSGAPSAERTILDKQRLQIFLNAINTLPQRSREAFLLHRVHDCSYREIATRLNISESAVEKLIMRALLYCRRALQEHDTD
ncbi:RNA polymerase sigma factor [Nitrospira sp. KM1]|uniref:RNA polymerase sigma factor n=1 Tax=Nitrospira sp. KM1 TaxID=1936990 RepID=UPI001563C9F0|nr:RNA polymerase sigma factor [Nitrospira sp. KM1]